MNSSLIIISTSNGRQVTVGALLTVPGNAKEYSAVATVFAGALQAVVRRDASYSPHNMAMLIVKNMALLFLLLLLLLRVVIPIKLPLFY